MGHYNFIQDLEQAKKTEEKVAQLLIKEYGATDISFLNTNEYDISATMSGAKLTFEIKEDFMCQFTGNVAVEFASRGKPSGIEVSNADYYVYVIHSKSDGKKIVEYLLYRTSELKRMIEDNLYFRIVSGGDPGSNTKNYLFSHDVFVNHGVRFALENV